MDQQQQQQQQLEQSSNSGSPRRRKPPIDLDAALYLQSKASLVQEPNSQSPTAKVANTFGNTNQQQQQQQHMNVTTRSFCAQQQQAVLTNIDPYYCALLRGDNNNYTLSNKYQYYYPAAANNISVDYIDCVVSGSNDFQQQQQQQQQQLAPAAAAGRISAMRGIPHCRKHLRFHRNRVEPSAVELAATQQQASPSSPRTSQHSSIASSNSLMAVSGAAAAAAAAAGDDDEILAPTSSHVAANNSLQRRNLAMRGDSISNNSNLTNATTDNSSGQNSRPLSGDGGETINNNDNNINASTGVLYPISVSEVKKRTYFIGSVGQDSLLGHDELYRYFPNGRVSIFVCTWNQNRKRAPMNLNDLLLPDQLVYMPDIYAIGIQEAFSSQNDYIREWEIELQTTLGPNHVLLHSCSLGVLHLALFVRRDLIWFCSTPEESVYNSRSMPTNMIKTKGAVSIAFRFFGTSFMFTNCHFPAHENKLKDRIDEYQRIINSIDLPKNLKLLKPRYLSNDSTARFDCVFFMGDLNFRLEHRNFDETIHIMEDIFQQKEPSYEALTQNDELLKVMDSNQAFYGFDESQIKFPPTYKFLAQTNKYDRQTKRVPSYTDRILFRSKRQRHIQCLLYDWLPQLLSSDHKPVYCLFDVLVRPGHEQNMVSSLNAGLFQRTIYLEALKRRAEDPESMRDNGAGGSLICSIS